MRKVILFIAVLLTMFSCNKDNSEDSTNKFSAEETELLNLLNGRWEKEDNYSPEVLSFSPYAQKEVIKSSVGGIGYFHGNAIRRFDYLGKQEEWNMYFDVNIGKKEIYLYGVEADGTYSIVRTKFYNYKIIDNNTIQLHDKSLSQLLVYNYKRIR